MERNILYRQLFGGTPQGSYDTELAAPPPLAYEQETALPLPAVHLTRKTAVTRSSTGRPFKLNENGQPEMRNPDTATADPALLIRIIEWLQVTKQERYRAQGGSTYCNIYAYDFCCFAGAFYPRVWWRNEKAMPSAAQVSGPRYEKDVTELNANAIFGWFKKHGGRFGWQELSTAAGNTLDEIQQLANQGHIVTLAYFNTKFRDLPNGGRVRRSGHVLMVAPESSHLMAHRANGRVVTPVHSQAGRKNFTFATTKGLPELFTAWQKQSANVKIFVKKLRAGGGTLSSNGPTTSTTQTAGSSVGAQQSSATRPSLNGAVQKNNHYAQQLGWQQYQEQINDLVLPWSGKSNVSLGPEDFAYAVQGWQLANGFTGKNADGVIGPGTWKRMQRFLRISGTSNNTPATTTGSTAPPDNIAVGKKLKLDGGEFKKMARGWWAWGGGPLKTRLLALQNKGLLQTTAFEMETLLLVSKSESDQLLNVVNSWDSAYMSMGYLQFTILHGKLHRLIRLAPDTFRSYGIELDGSRAYTYGKSKIPAIKGAATLEDLRSLDWARRFYKAGLEDAVAVAQVKIFREEIADIRKSSDPGGFLSRFDGQHPHLWAFIYESYNSRPSILKPALKKAIAGATGFLFSSAANFGKLLYDELRITTRAFYIKQDAGAKRIQEELDKIDRIWKNTKMV